MRSLSLRTLVAIGSIALIGCNSSPGFDGGGGPDAQDVASGGDAFDGGDGTDGATSDAVDVSTADRGLADVGADAGVPDAAHADVVDASTDDASIDLSGGAVPPYPGITPARVVAGPSTSLIVARDEHHVILVTSTPGTSCTYDPNLGPMTLVTLPASGAATTQVLYANATAPAFSSDSMFASFISDPPDPCTPTGTLQVAAVGSAPRVIAPGVVNARFVGQAIFYWLSAGRRAWTLYGVPRAGGTPQLIAMVPFSTFVAQQVSPSESGVAYQDMAGATWVVSTSTLTATMLLPATTPPDAFYWTHAGDRIALTHDVTAGSTNRAITMFHADGTGRTDVTTTCSACYDFAFSPDDLRIAYDVVSPTDNVDVIIHALAGTSPDVRVANVPASMARAAFGILGFTPNGQYVWAASTTETVITTGALGAAPSASNGTFAEIGYDFGDSTEFAVSPGSDYLAYCDGTHQYFATFAGATTGSPLGMALGGSLGRWEPDSTAPHFIALDYTASPGGIRVYPHDGVEPPGVLPGGAENNLGNWLGHDILYQLYSALGTPLQDEIVASGYGATVGTVGRFVSAAAWADIAAPTTLFYLRDPLVGGGLWSVRLP